MEKEKLETSIALNYTQRQLAVHFSCSQSTIKYWLKRYDLKTLKTKEIHAKTFNIGEKFCYKCSKVKNLDEFYINTSQCKSCHNNQKVKRGQLMKIKMIHYLGSKCKRCDQHVENTHPNVFDFHHQDHNDKEFDLSKLRYFGWGKIKKEIDKCILLCANCHRIEHAHME